MTRLILMRHGPTSWNKEFRLQGRTDIPLSAAGRKSVATWRLVPEITKTSIWYSSPLCRAVETAALLGHRDAMVEPALTEMSWGEWEGRTLEDLNKTQEYSHLSFRDGLDFRPPGGESKRDIIDRLRPFWARVAARDVPVVAITHKGVIEATMAVATGWDMRTKRPAKVGLGASHLFEVDQDGVLSVIRLNVNGEEKT